VCVCVCVCVFFGPRKGPGRGRPAEPSGSRKRALLCCHESYGDGSAGHLGAGVNKRNRAAKEKRAATSIGRGGRKKKGGKKYVALF